MAEGSYQCLSVEYLSFTLGVNTELPASDGERADGHLCHHDKEVSIRGGMLIWEPQLKFKII